ncbi:MAG: lysophospholipid acyltransferase family protein [Nibricoccus sp.]
MNKDFAAWFIRVVCGIKLVPAERLPTGQAIYFANHSSHLDFATIWAALPQPVRLKARPVAAKDYWDRSRFRRWLARDFFRSVLIERQNLTVANNPLETMVAALQQGDSLIVFPEGTRSLDGKIHEFKSGLHHLAKARPEIPLVPIYLQDLSRILPKGEFLPVPLLGSLSIGEPLHLQPDEPKSEFLQRARRAILALSQQT